MVEYFDVEILGGLFYFIDQFFISFAGFQAARRVIVAKNQAHSVFFQGSF
jgi:hypothetical protein